MDSAYKTRSLFQVYCVCQTEFFYILEIGFHLSADHSLKVFAF